MIFFIVAAAVMAMLIVSIHKLAGHFGCELPLSSLVLCGVCAIVINFVIISVTPFLTNSYYYTAGAMILFAAFGTTCYNKYLLHRKIHLAGGGTLLPAEAGEITEAETEAALCASSGQETEVTAEETADIREEAEAAAADDDVRKEAEADDAHEETEATVAAGEAYVEAEAAVDTGEAYEYVEAAVTADHIREEMGAAEDADEALEEAEAEAETAEEAEPDDELDSELDDILSSMTTMDQLLDFAFEQGMQKQHQVALAAYQTALERYRSDSYAPFIVVSIANIHKELGNYDAAIDSIRSAMDIPAMLESSSIRRQFEDTMSYLVITRSVLQTAGLGAISFKEIPKKYMSQIESIYNSRKSR